VDVPTTPEEVTCSPLSRTTCFSERDTGTKKDMLAVSFTDF
jgi:hypothetical protein